MSEAAVVTGADIVAGLRELGIAPGDLIFVHASLSSFGHVEGGVDTLIDALFEAVGPEGTVAMPGFTFQQREHDPTVFDVLNTPVWASRVYERFRTRPGTVRSHHPNHSVLASGARAREFVAEHGPYPCQAPSPFAKLAEWGGKLLLMGVSHNSSTTLHAVEEHEKLPEVGYALIPDVILRDEEGNERPVVAFQHWRDIPYEFNRLDPLFVAAGVQQQTLIGDAIVRCLDVRGMWDVAAEAARRDPAIMLMQGGEHVNIPVCRADLEQAVTNQSPSG